MPILLVLHLSARLPPTSDLSAVLGWHTCLRVKWAEGGEVAAPGIVYVAPPGQHLVMRSRHRLALSSAAPVGWWRPAVDVLFQSATDARSALVVAVVLRGMMWDGAKGIAAVAKCGGITIAQDETCCTHFDMPAAAIDFGHADLVMSPPKIAEALLVLAGGCALTTDV